ncbi:MAG: metallophosphoesterase [Candidatus Bipolaricaulota bacterium]
MEVDVKLGILSDSHDRLPALEAIVERFNAENVDLILHAGDFVSPFTSIPLSRLRAPLLGVFGNNDGDRLYLTQRFEGIGTLHSGYHVFEVDGLRAVLMHEPKSIDALAASGQVDLIVYGHTHEAVLRQGRPAIINPGEASGWLTGRATAALFDTQTMTGEIVRFSL